METLNTILTAIFNLLPPIAFIAMILTYIEVRKLKHIIKQKDEINR